MLMCPVDSIYATSVATARGAANSVIANRIGNTRRDVGWKTKTSRTTDDSEMVL